MKSTNLVGYVYDPILTLHTTRREGFHPERPERILEIYKELLNRGLIQKMIPIKTREATKEELLYAHDKEYVDQLEWKLRGSKGILNQVEEQYNSVYVNEHTLECAKTAAGSVINLVQKVMLDEITSGVAIVRPPGHHAERDRAMGFCIYNSVAIVSKMLSAKGTKVLIVDYDIHANNGTIDIVKGDANILCFSIHRYNNGTFYPHIMSQNKDYVKKHSRDTRDATNIINVNLNGYIGDKEYVLAFKNHLTPRLAQFTPDIIIVSAGFDGIEGDPLGESHLTNEGYKDMTGIMKNICPKMVMVLEGGYNIEKMAKAFADCTEILM